MTTLKDKMKALSPRRRARVHARAAELIAEELSLRELRKARQKTQHRVAVALGIGQDGVSRLEQRADLLLSTLRAYIEAMGGHLEIIARFSDREPVILTGFADVSNEAPQATRGSKPRLRTNKVATSPKRRSGRRHAVLA
jgi:transcriptional regulator with XRE-family HTH domain